MMFIKVKNLYIGKIGMVYKKNGYYSIPNVERIIAFHKKKTNDIYDNYLAVDVLTNREYYFLFGNKKNDITIARAVGTDAICDYYPIEQFITINSNRVSKRKIIKLLKELNDVLYEKKAKAREVIVDSELKDAILISIKDTYEKVKNGALSNEIKNSLCAVLIEMADNYLLDVTKKSEGDVELMNISDWDLKMKYIRQLAEVEQVVNDPDKNRAFSLKKQVNRLKDELKN